MVGYEAMVVEAGVSTRFPSLWDQLEVFPHGKLRLRKAMPEATVGYRCDFETKVLLDRFDQFSGRPPPDTGCDPDVYCLWPEGHSEDILGSSETRPGGNLG